MIVLGWIGSVIVGAATGWALERLDRAGTGVLHYVILGVAGALVLNMLVFAAIGATLGGWVAQVIIAVTGACLLIAVARMLRNWA